jgi:hypothetical protein
LDHLFRILCQNKSYKDQGDLASRDPRAKVEKQKSKSLRRIPQGLCPDDIWLLLFYQLEIKKAQAFTVGKKIILLKHTKDFLQILPGRLVF